jgi:hypothetical protein
VELEGVEWVWGGGSGYVLIYGSADLWI